MFCNSFRILILLLFCSLFPALPSFGLQAGEDSAEGVENLLDEHLDFRWTGDLDGMIKRRKLRILIVCDDMFYFLDRGRQRGITYEYMRHLEKFVNQRLNRDATLKINMVFIPATRERLLDLLVDGYGDIAAGNITITRERMKRVDFTEPLVTNISELLVTGPSAPHLSSISDLSGRAILVRRASSYHEHLADINRIFIHKGLKPIILRPASTYLQDSDLLQMVSSGVLDWAVVDSHKANLWSSVLPGLIVRRDIVIHSGGDIAWAIRKDSPKLKALLNSFVRENRKGTLFGNILINRYFRNNRWLKNPSGKRSLKRFSKVMKLFKKYGKEYSFDWIMLAALAYQESELDNRRRSHRGAVGIMQMLPSTARDPNVNVHDIHNLEGNIEAGTRYLRFLRDRYFSGIRSSELNRLLFTLAAYNAGPRRIVSARKQAKRMNLDPDVWFGNVEIAVADMIGRETVTYVSNIYKYYIAYRLIVQTSGKEKGEDALVWSLGKI